MALQVADRVQVTATANTTVSFTLGSAVTGYQSFSVITNGNTTYYAATDTTGNWEVGLGTYSSSGPTLNRTTILSSSNSGSAVTFSGTVTVFVTYPAEKSVNQDANGNVNIPTYVSNTTTTIGTLNVGTGGYSVSTTGQLATFYGADTTWSNVVLQNNNGGNTSYSSFVTTANNYSNVYMEMGTNSSTYSYTAAGYGNNSANAANTNFVESVGSDLAITTFGSNAIHFVVNSGSTGTTSDALTISTAGNVTTPNVLTGAEVVASNGLHVNSQTVSASYSIPSGSSAMSAGPVTLSSGVSVTVPSGSRWVVL